MTEITEHQTKVIRDIIAAAQIETKSVPIREHGVDDVTIRAHAGTIIEIPEFGFKDFELDLSCLSTPPSPEPVILELRQSTPSPPPSSPSVRSISFASSSPSPSLGRSPTKRSAARRSPVPRGPVVRGTFPLMKYVGRGTPVDKSRRIEWAGISSDDVGEDGVLFSNVRSTSLDSALRPSQRSISPEWHILPPTRRPSTLPMRSRSRMFTSAVEKPEIKLEGLSSDNSEWSSILQTVLGSTESTSTAASTSNIPTPVQDNTPEPSPEPNTVAMMSPEEVQQLDTGLEIDLGINEALDLGLGTRGGMNWFVLGLLPASGRESPSVYSSQLPTPQASRPPSPGPSDHQSTTTSMKAQPNGVLELKSVSQTWWRKMMGRLRRIPFFASR